jgi:hypothetical protein
MDMETEYFRTIYFVHRNYIMNLLLLLVACHEHVFISIYIYFYHEYKENYIPLAFKILQ